MDLTEARNKYDLEWYPRKELEDTLRCIFKIEFTEGGECPHGRSPMDKLLDMFQTVKMSSYSHGVREIQGRIKEALG